MVKLLIDPGHGGNDPGASGHGLLEKVVALNISKKVKAYLESNYSGVTVRLTRDSDTTLSLNARTKNANNWGASYLMSIHLNAGGGTGFESFIFNGKSTSSKTISARSIIHDEIIKKTGKTDRGKKRANFHMLRESSMPSILTENFFIDRKADTDSLKQASFIDGIVEGHAIGFAKAYNLKTKTGKGHANTTNPKPSVEPSKPVKSPKTSTSSSYSEVNGNWTGQTLVRGTKGKPVRQLQNSLASNSPPFYPNKKAKNNGIDSFYGKDTENAVYRFQSYYGLGYDGIAGRQVYNKLNGAKTSTAKKTSYNVGNTVTLKRSAKTFATGQSILNSAKGKKYKIIQTKKNSVLLGGIMSWVRKSDVH